MAQSPFLGMVPYLESHNLWLDVHNRLISVFAEQLAPQLAPKYVAELQTQLIIGQVGQDPMGIRPDISITRTDSESFDAESYDDHDDGEDGDTAVAVKPAKVARINYSLPPVPRLKPRDVEWAKSLSSL